MPEYLFLTKCIIQAGDTAKFWKDWTDDIVQHRWPHLFSFALDTNISVHRVVSAATVDDLFVLPLSEEAYQEWEMFEELIHGLEIRHDKDEWVYSWGKDYCVSKAYKFFQGEPHLEPSFSWLWNSCCQKKHKVFAWYLLHNRLNTRALLQRKNFHLHDYNCIMCGSQ